MSLESQIGILTDAVRELTSALNSYGVRQHNAEVVKTVEAKRILPLTDADHKPKEELPNAKSEETQQTTSPASEPTEPESAPVTYQDVKDVTISMSKTDLAKTKAALSRFGVASAKGLKEEQWAEYHAYLLKVQAGEINPEESHG